MAKRKTKTQLALDQKDKLLQRLNDLYNATTGDFFQEDCQPWPTEFMQFVMVTKRVFCLREKDDPKGSGNEHLWDLWNLDEFRTPETACEHLFGYGVRA